jgi:hypothetical protein
LVAFWRRGALRRRPRRYRRRRELDIHQRRFSREISTKHRIGKLVGVAAIVLDLDRAIADPGFVGLPISLRHAQVAGGLPGPHRDPFDRMLIAQAILETLVLVSNERPFYAYGVTRLWQAEMADSRTSDEFPGDSLTVKPRQTFWRLAISAKHDAEAHWGRSRGFGCRPF